MRYLVNLPVIGAFLCGWGLVHLTILTNPPRGGDAGMGAAFAIVGSGVFLWGLLAVVLAGAAMAGAFDWMPGESRGGRVVVVLLAYGAIVLISLLPIGVAMETAGDTANRGWSPGVIWAARAVAEGLPLVLLAYAAWNINAPETLRDLPGLRYGLIGSVGLLGVVAVAVSVQELGRWNKQAGEAAAAEREREDGKIQERRREFAALTDSDTLLKWYEFSTYSSPDDVRVEALRRIGQRPNLEAELIAVLRSANDLWAAEGVWFVADLAITPSPALAEATGQRIAIYAAELDAASKSVTYDGDKRLDYYERSKLLKSLAAATRVAESAGADLRPQIDALLKSVALYPKSDMAHEFPREAAAAKKRIDSILSSRTPK